MYATLVILFSLLSCAIPWQTGQDQHQPTQSDNKTSDKADSAQNIPSVQEPAAPPAQQYTKGEHATSEPESKPWLTHGEWVNSILTLAYVVISLFAFFAIKRQADLTESQAEKSIAEFSQQIAEMQKSSASAQTSADALINSERPWVVPEIRKKVRWINSLSTDKETLGQPCKRRVVYFTFSITNHGRTPAEIVGIRGNPYLTNKGIHGGLEDPPDYGLEYVFMQVRILAPRQRWDYNDVDLEFRWADEETMKEIEAFKLHRIFKGVVLYRDVFKPEILHESRFCYTYFAMREEYLPSGPPGHTKYT